MRIDVFENGSAAGQAAAALAAETIVEAVATHGRARIVAATGASQIAFLEALTATPDLPWSRVELFHLDEYIGLPITHPASFGRYLLERLIRPAGIETYHLLDGEADADLVCEDVGRAVTHAPIDVAFVGIGENGHLAFNDPPADFETNRPYFIVDLDEACRRQQVREGWFPALEEVPRRAMTMSVRQILAARRILCIVSDERKAAAVKACLSDGISPLAPASILRIHPDTTLFADRASTALLEPALIAQGEVR